MARATKRRDPQELALKAIEDSADRAVARLRLAADEAARTLQDAVLSAAGISPETDEPLPAAIDELLDTALANIIRSFDAQAQQIQEDARAAIERVEDETRLNRSEEKAINALTKQGVDPETAEFLTNAGIGLIRRKDIGKGGQVRRRRFASLEDATNYIMAGKSAPVGYIRGIVRLNDGFYIVVSRSSNRKKKKAV